MTLRHTITLSLAAALFAAGFVATADAATRHARSHGTHMVAAHGRTHAVRTTAPAAGADHSADSLNAQSLTRAQGATQ